MRAHLVGGKSMRAGELMPTLRHVSGVRVGEAVIHCHRWRCQNTVKAVTIHVNVTEPGG